MIGRRRRGAPAWCVVGVLGVVTALATMLAACGSSGPTLTLYSAQHQDLVQAWLQPFTQQTGIQVEVRRGGDFELANQILAEGASSPADVVLTENSPALSMLSSQGRLAKLDPATLAQVPAQFASGAGDWVGVAARSTVLVYNPALLRPDQLPHSILELAAPQWRNRIAFAPSGADFQAIVSAVFAVNGPASGEQWLAGLKQNGRIYSNNITTMKAVNAGEVPAGVIYHYYWYQDQAEGGTDSRNTRLAYFDAGDGGSYVSVSGAGVVASTDQPSEAQRLVAFMSGRQGQQILAGTDASQYTVGAGVPSSPKLTPFSQLGPPKIDLNTLNGPQVVSAMQRVGLL